jgi:DNA-binding winged helix-turn-helix (wHTH) protein/Flp pilus assembly protein TadD
MARNCNDDPAPLRANEPHLTSRPLTMPFPTAGRGYEFGGLRFDPARGLERQGRWVPLAPLERRALEALLAAAGRVVSKDALALAVWCHREVSDESVTRVVYRLRQALRGAGAPGALVTVYRSGFRMAVPVLPIDLGPGVVHPGALASVATARELLGGRSPRDLAVATVAARRAVRLDRQHAEGWLLLARISLLRVLRGRIGRAVGLRRARHAAAHAHALAPHAGGGLAVLAWLDAVHDEDMSALALLNEAVACNPHDAFSQNLRAWALLAAGRPEDGIGAFAVAQGLDPLSRTWTAVHGYALACCGRVSDAFALLNSAIRRMPDTDTLLSARSSVAAVAGDVELALADARRAIALAPDVAAHRVALACALGARGDGEAARPAFAEAARGRFGVAPSTVALFLAAIGDDAAVATAWSAAQMARCVERGLVQHDPRLQLAVAGSGTPSERRGDVRLSVLEAPPGPWGVEAMAGDGDDAANTARTVPAPTSPDEPSSAYGTLEGASAFGKAVPPQSAVPRAPRRTVGA